jgi:hypothetical protein
MNRYSTALGEIADSRFFVVISSGTFQIDRVSHACKSPIRLIALIKTDDTVKKILTAMGLPQRRPNSGQHDRLPRNLVARAESG